MEREWVNSEEWNRCFGCSPHNELGLRLTFTEQDDGTIESRYQAPEHLVGPPGTVHGGIQAVLLDEVMGMTARIAVGSASGWAVTAELSLKYRRPVPVGNALLVRGRLLRTDGDNLFIGGEILGPDQEVLTTAKARFKFLEGVAGEPVPPE